MNKKIITIVASILGVIILVVNTFAYGYLVVKMRVVPDIHKNMLDSFLA